MCVRMVIYMCDEYDEEEKLVMYSFTITCVMLCVQNIHYYLLIIFAVTFQFHARKNGCLCPVCYLSTSIAMCFCCPLKYSSC